MPRERLTHGHIRSSRRKRCRVRYCQAQQSYHGRVEISQILRNTGLGFAAQLESELRVIDRLCEMIQSCIVHTIRRRLRARGKGNECHLLCQCMQFQHIPIQAKGHRSNPPNLTLAAGPVCLTRRMLKAAAINQTLQDGMYSAVRTGCMYCTVQYSTALTTYILNQPTTGMPAQP